MDSKADIIEEPAQETSGAQASMRACPECGETARRVAASYCSNCGRLLDESYLPTDALRASYNLQQQRRRSSNHSEGRASDKLFKSSMSSIFPARNSNGASTTALAFMTYALVPYLGILFCPGALLMGGVGLYNSYRAPERGGRRASYMSLSFGLLIFCAQLFLWWILYKIPEWTGR
jgi:hypothetical protein